MSAPAQSLAILAREKEPAERQGEVVAIAHSNGYLAAYHQYSTSGKRKSYQAVKYQGERDAAKKKRPDMDLLFLAEEGRFELPLQVSPH